MQAPAAFQSALIESLRGSAGNGGQEGTGIKFLPNAAPTPGGGLVMRDYRGMAFNPQMLTMPVAPPWQAPTPPPPGEELTPVPPVRDIDPLPPIDDIVIPDVPEDDPVVPALPDVPDVPDAPELDPLPEDDIPPLPEDVVLPEVDPIPGLPDVAPEPPPSDDKPDALTPIPDPIVVDVKPPKRDASGWGEGGEDLVRDPEATPTPVVPDPLPEEEIPLLPEDVPLPEVLPVPEVPVAPPAAPEVPVLPQPPAPDVVPEPAPTDERPEALVPIPDTIEVKPPKRDASGWGEGGDNLVRDDSVIVPALPDPAPVMPEVLPELPVEDIPLLPEDVDLPEVLPVPELPVALPDPMPATPDPLPELPVEEVPLLPEDVDLPEALLVPEPPAPEPKPEDAPIVEVESAPPVRYTPDTAPVIQPLEQAPVDRATPTPSPEPLPEDIDLPEVEPVPEIVVPSLPDPVPVLPEDLAPIDDPIDLLPEDIVLPEVMPVPELPMSPSDLAPIEPLPEEIDLPVVDDVPELTGNEAALTDLYAEVFNRAPDQGGFDFWLWAMNDLGYTPEMVRAEFLRSPEYQDLQAQQRDRRLLDESAFVG